MGKYYYNEVSLLKAMATCFITLFHFKWTVPQEYSTIFVGGAIGNSIFFFCSGYLLNFKEEKFSGEWFLKKYMRIMPTVWLMNLTIIICNVLRCKTSVENLQHWIYPIDYWFVECLLVFFFVMYVTRRWIRTDVKEGDRIKHKYNLFVLCFLALIMNILWFVLFEENKTIIIMDAGGIRCWFYFFLFFLWGYYVRNYKDRVRVSCWSWLKVIVAIGLFYAYKKMPNKELIIAQVIFIPLLLAFIVLSFRQLAKTILVFHVPKFIEKGIVLLSNLTLEIYIVQMYLINWIMPLFPFPLNILISLIFIIILAYTIKQAVNIIFSKCIN